MFRSTRNIHIIFPLFVLIILVFMPLFLILLRSVTPNGEFSGFAPFTIIFEQHYQSILLNSLLLGVGVVIGASILAAPIAFFMAFTTLRKHRWIDIVIIVPFMTPPYIGAMGWILMMQRNGYAEQLVPGLATITPYFFSFFGIVLVMSLHLFPFIYLIMRNTLENISSRLEEAAIVHGGSFFNRLRRVTTPLFLSGYSMGALLVFVKTIGEFGTPVTLGNRIGFYVLTSEIHHYSSVWPIDYGKAAILSTMLLGISMMIWFFQQWFAARNQHKVVTGKGHAVKLIKLGRSGWFVWGYLSIVLFLAIAVPYFSIISTTFLNIQGNGLAFTNLTIEHIVNLFANDDSRMALWNSIWLSLIAATVTSILGVWITLIVMKHRNPVTLTTDFLALAPDTVPGIVIVVGLILFWNGATMPFTIYNTWAMLVLAYVILYLPFTIQNVKALYGQLGNSLVEAAMISGASNWYQFRSILFPLLLPGILSGWILTFTISMRELVGSLILRPPNMHTSATYIYTQFDQGSTSLGMAMALVTVGFTTVMLMGIEYMKTKSQTHKLQ